MLPTKINENDDVFYPFVGNVKYLKSVLYEQEHYPLRLLFDGKDLKGFIVIYVSSNNLLCIEPTTDSLITVPLSTLESQSYCGFNYRIYVKEKKTC